MTAETLQMACMDMAPHTNRIIVFGQVNAELPGLESYIEYLSPLFDGTIGNTDFTRWVRLGNNHRKSPHPDVANLKPPPAARPGTESGLAVKSFKEFLKKFKPQYYYRLKSYNNTPGYEFSLTRDENYRNDWLSVTIDSNDPLLDALISAISQRSLTGRATIDVNVSVAFKPFSAPMVADRTGRVLRDLHIISSALEKGEQSSLRDAYLETHYEAKNLLKNRFRLMTTVAQGLSGLLPKPGAQNAAESNSKNPPVKLILGPNGPMLETLSPSQNLLTGTENSASSTANTELQSIPVSELLKRYDIFPPVPRERREIKAISELPEEEQFPEMVGDLLGEMVRSGEIQDYEYADLIKVALTCPEKLRDAGADPLDLARWHDIFQASYAISIQHMLKTVGPLYELILSIWALFREFDAVDVAGENEVIIANADLNVLWDTQGRELKRFFELMCNQLENKYKDAISAAIIQSSSRLTESDDEDEGFGWITADDYVNNQSSDRRETSPSPDNHILSAKIAERLQHKAQSTAGPVTSAATQGLMRLGEMFGFLVFFSPSDPIYLQEMSIRKLMDYRGWYAPDWLTGAKWSAAGVCCMPDFVAMPPSAQIRVGQIADGRYIVVNSPRFGVSASFVAAGRIMANDNVKVLKSRLDSLNNSSDKELSSLAKSALFLPNPHNNLPALAVDILKHKVCAATSFASDDFLTDEVMTYALDAKNPFLLFRHRPGHQAQIMTPRTLRKDRIGRFTYIHHFRQLVFLERLLKLANTDNQRPSKKLIEKVIGEMLDGMPLTIPGTNTRNIYSPWYQPSSLNSFPSQLSDDRIQVDEEGADNYSITINFADNFTSAFHLRIQNA